MLMDESGFRPWSAAAPSWNSAFPAQDLAHSKCSKVLRFLLYCAFCFKNRFSKPLLLNPKADGSDSKRRHRSGRRW